MRHGPPTTLAALGVIGLLASGTPAPVAGAPPPRSEGWQASARRADALLHDVAAGAVGLSAAVVRGDGSAWTHAYGLADVASERPVGPETRMRLYSLAKPMTAVAAARLMERGRLDPAAPIQRYVPDFPDKGAPITAMQLAEHTSGIRHYANDAEAHSLRHCDTVDEALEIFADDPLVHAPGERETYSSWGYVLLSAVLEGAAGHPYPELMHELIFDPLGLDSPAIDDPLEDVPDRASFYRETEPGTFVAAEPVDNTCKWGAGAWLGTAADVARFGLGMVDGTLLQPRTEQMFLRGEPVYRAQGWSAGGMAFLIVDDEHRLAVALLSNAIGDTLGPSLQQAVARIHEIFTDEQTRPGGRRRGTR